MQIGHDNTIAPSHEHVTNIHDNGIFNRSDVDPSAAHSLDLESAQHLIILCEQGDGSIVLIRMNIGPRRKGIFPLGIAQEA